MLTGNQDVLSAWLLMPAEEKECACLMRQGDSYRDGAIRKIGNQMTAKMGTIDTRLLYYQEQPVIGYHRCIMNFQSILMFNLNRISA